MLMLENTNCNRDDENSNQKEGSAKRCVLTIREEEMDGMDSNTPCDSDPITLFTASSHKHGQKRPRDDSETVENWTAVTSRKHLPAACKNPASVAKRNARERRRIKNVNVAFDELRQHVPLGEQNKKKISKVDTLQSAIEYIKALEKLVKRKREFETSSEESGKDDTDMTGYTPRSNSLDDENGSMFSHSGSAGPSINPDNWYPGTDRRPRNFSTNSTDVEPTFRRSESGQSWQSENIVDANRRDNDSGYSDCSLLVGSMEPVSPCQNGSFAPDTISAFTPYAPLLREVSPDDVETLLDNTSTDVDAPRTRGYYTDYGFISSVVPVGSQQVSYSTPLPPPPDPGLVCALTSNDCGNPLSHESNSMARIGANMSEYTDSNEGYRFGDAYA